MLEDYLTELGRLVGGDWDPQDYAWLDVQWSEPGRHPFFILFEGERVGFALVRESQSTGTGLIQMGEFYLGGSHRGTGLAGRAAGALFRRFPGRWEFSAHLGNPRAVQFWQRIIEAECGAKPQMRTVDDVRFFSFDVA